MNVHAHSNAMKYAQSPLPCILYMFVIKIILLTCLQLLDPNGRKEMGGKLEVHVRVREPLLQRQVEVIQEKFLIIDQFVRLQRPVHVEKAVSVYIYSLHLLTYYPVTILLSQTFLFTT